jgi:hypothetical protein
MSDVLTINSSTISLAAHYTTLDRVVPYVKGGIPELHFSRIVGALAALPDPWSGKPVGLTMLSGTAVFAGDVVGYVDRYMDGIGWVREYRCLGLLNRANYIPVTDSLTDTDTAVFNLPGDDPNFIGARAGLSVGAIVAEVLTMAANATALNNAGIGNYTSLGPPAVLPSVTTTDLAALSIVPQWRVSVSGERILQAIEQLVQSVYPSTFLHVDPSGNIRFFTTYNFSANTWTLGGDPRILPPSLTRDYSDCYSQVLVRGNTLVQGVTLQTQPWPGSSSSDGGLQEDFAWGSFSNAAAKAAWVPADWSQPNQYGAPYDTGSCTCPSTTTVTCATALTYSANQLSQANGLGMITLYADVITGITQIWQARIVSNTASSGGHITVTLDNPLPALTYNAYQIFALALGANVVGRRYRASNAAIGAAMLNYFPWQFAYVNSQGNAASLTSTPIGTVMWGAFGGASPPYNTGFDSVTLDPVNGLIYFDKPTQVVVNGLNTPTQWPANVQAFVPISVGTLTAQSPSGGGYSGTLDTVEGVQRTKTITVLDWRDYGNQSNMQAFADEYLKAVQDVVVEGVLPYLALPTATYLSPGQAISIAGIAGSTAYTTGYESLALPVVSCEITFQPGPQGTSYSTALHLSNRRGRYSYSNYLRPNITGAQFGAESTISAAGVSEVAYQGMTPWNTGPGNPGMVDGYKASVQGFQQMAQQIGDPAGDMARDLAGQVQAGAAQLGGMLDAANPGVAQGG